MSDAVPGQFLGRVFAAPVDIPFEEAGWTELGYMKVDGVAFPSMSDPTRLSGLKGGRIVMLGVNVNPALEPGSWRLYHWFSKQLERYTYKDHFEFYVDASSPYHTTLTIKARVPDARWRPSEAERAQGRRPPLVTIAGRSAIPEHLYEQPDLFADWLLARIHDVESHETDEWFRRDGEIYRDPHLKQGLTLPAGPIGPIDGPDGKSARLTLWQRLTARFARLG